MTAENETEEGDLDRPFPVHVTPEDLDHWFTHHPPRQGQQGRYEEARRLGKQLATFFAEFTPPGPDQMRAIRLVREAVMTGNVAIACEGEVQSAYYWRKFERSLQDRAEEVEVEK